MQRGTLHPGRSRGILAMASYTEAANMSPGTAKRKASEASDSVDSLSSKRKKAKQSWTSDEDKALHQAVLDVRRTRELEKGEVSAEGNNGSGQDGEDEEDDWDDIAKSVPGKTAVQCLQRYMKTLNERSGSPNGADATNPSVSNNPTCLVIVSANSVSDRHCLRWKLQFRIQCISCAAVIVHYHLHSFLQPQASGARTEASSDDDASGGEGGHDSNGASVPIEWSAEESNQLKKVVEEYQGCEFVSLDIYLYVYTWPIVR